MESLRCLYRIGPGPSSSHSLGVRNACEYYRNLYPDHEHYLVELYGSLALTGEGHMTDTAIRRFFGQDSVTVEFRHEEPEHPNTMKMYCIDNGIRTNGETIFSVGGGAISIKGKPPVDDPGVYPETTLTEICDLCERENISLAEYVFRREPDIGAYLDKVLNQMIRVIDEGLAKDGYLPGPLHLEKVARRIYEQALVCRNRMDKQKLILTAYAYAAMEESNSGAMVVTAPTLGSCGVVCALAVYYHNRAVSRQKIIEALAVAGLIGNIVKSNATISGAEGGCQAEIGTACAMGAAFAAHLAGLSNSQIEYAAEVAMEHNLGLTCDPVGGYVQIPCIERNGVAVLRAIDACDYAKYLGVLRKNRVSFDMVVNVMKHTGSKIPMELRETSLGGLAIELGNTTEIKNN